MDSYDITIITLLVFCFFTLIKLLLKGDTEDSSLQKIFGGMVVLSGALASQNPWAISLSIFIAGLIIASEDFMKFFAAVMKTSADKIPETIEAFRVKTTPPKEIAEKAEIEIQEIKKLEENASTSDQGREDTLTSKENVDLSPDKYDEILPRIEENVLSKLEKSLNQKIDRHGSFSGLNLIVDGNVIDNDKRILRLFEVKVFPRLPKNKHGKIMTSMLVDSVKRTLEGVIHQLDTYFKSTSGKSDDWKHILTVAIVLNTNSDFIKIRRRVETLNDYFNSITTTLKVNFVFYNLKNTELDIE